MARKRAAGVLIAVGVVLVAISAFAEPLGLGADDGVGWKQATGIVVGAVLALVGLAMLFVRRGHAKTPQALA
jgi:hypothetical protein